MRQAGRGRRFYQLHNNTVVGGIRINQRGREQPGVVAPADLEDVLELIQHRLSSLVNLRSGEPIVHRFVRGEDVHEGDDDALLPDLYVEWNRSVQIERVWSPELGIVQVPYTHWRTGDHNDDGTLFVTGPDIAPGRDAEPIDVVDLPATICRRLGAELPDADGTSMPWAEQDDQRA